MLQKHKVLIDFIGNFTDKFFAPFGCNQKMITKTQKKIHEGSYLFLPAGTRVMAYFPSDTKDLDSDVEMQDIVLTKSATVVFVDSPDLNTSYCPFIPLKTLS